MNKEGVIEGQMSFFPTPKKTRRVKVEEIIHIMKFVEVEEGNERKERLSYGKKTKKFLKEGERHCITFIRKYDNEVIQKDTRVIKGL